MRTRIRHLRLPGRWNLLALVLFVLAAMPSGATTVKKISTVELLSAPQLIIQGRVLEQWSEPGQNRETIVTKVSIQVTELIKGELDSELVVLEFLGGTLNGLTMKIEGSNIPAVGEEGFYFIESTARNYVNPIYGWTQGHFIVSPDDGSVRTVGGDAVYALELVSGPPTLEFAKAHAVGVSVDKISLAAAPLKADQFRQKLEMLLEEVVK